MRHCPWKQYFWVTAAAAKEGGRRTMMKRWVPGVNYVWAEVWGSAAVSDKNSLPSFRRCVWWHHARPVSTLTGKLGCPSSWKQSFGQSRNICVAVRNAAPLLFSASMWTREVQVAVLASHAGGAGSNHCHCSGLPCVPNCKPRNNSPIIAAY